MERPDPILTPPPVYRPEAPPTTPSHRRRAFFVAGGALILIVLFSLVGRVSYSFRHMTEDGDGVDIAFETLEGGIAPHRDSDRANLLIIGIRGEDDPEGGLLSDVLVVASLQKSTGRVALISVPRDLWVAMPGTRTHNKINEAYALGFEHGGRKSALEYSTAVVQRATGLAIDGAVSVNLRLVRELIDALGGITVNVERTLVEDQQWVLGGDMGQSSAFFIRTDTVTSAEGMVTESQRWVFSVPRGTRTMDGLTALYYVRARYTTSDFDRARREQQVILAVRDKLTSTGILLNPIRANQLLRALERNVATNIPVTKFPEYAELAAKADTAHVRRIVLDTSPEGMLKASRSEGGAYILLPQSGDFNAIRTVCRDAFLTPTATPTPPPAAQRAPKAQRRSS